MYSIGHLEYPQDDDARFDTEEEAIEQAVYLSIDDGVWAVWEHGTGEVRNE